MSGWSPSIDIPVLQPAFSPRLIVLSAFVMVLTAPDPAVTGATTLTTAEIIATAPDPEVNGTIALTSLTMRLTSPDPERVSDNVLSVPTAEAVMTGPDPTLLSPSLIQVESFGINATAPDPTINYGYVTSEVGPEFKAVPTASTQGDQHRRQIASVLNRTMQGKLACTGTFTLRASVPATYLRDARLSETSWVEFDPLTANATAEKTNGTMYVLEANRKEGQWLITHANNSQTDRKFRFSILG